MVGKANQSVPPKRRVLIIKMTAILRVALKITLAEEERHGERGNVAPYEGVSAATRYDLSLLLSPSWYSSVFIVYIDALQVVGYKAGRGLSIVHNVESRKAVCAVISR